MLSRRKCRSCGLCCQYFLWYSARFSYSRPYCWPLSLKTPQRRARGLCLSLPVTADGISTGCGRMAHSSSLWLPAHDTTRTRGGRRMDTGSFSSPGLTITGKYAGCAPMGRTPKILQPTGRATRMKHTGRRMGSGSYLCRAEIPVGRCIG